MYPIIVFLLQPVIVFVIQPVIVFLTIALKVSCTLLRVMFFFLQYAHMCMNCPLFSMQWIRLVKVGLYIHNHLYWFLEYFIGQILSIILANKNFMVNDNASRTSHFHNLSDYKANFHNLKKQLPEFLPNWNFFNCSIPAHSWLNKCPVYQYAFCQPSID